MRLTTTGRVQRTEFRVKVHFDKTRADILTFEFPDAYWAIGRDLIAAGLMAPTGEMDVRIWPDADTDEVAIELETPSGHAIIRLPRDPVASFVRYTYERVPRGTEYDGLDWGQLLATTGGA